MSSKSIALITLGCPRNIVDSEEAAGRLRKKGARLVDIEQAEVVIINTCAFIREAKEESIAYILDALELKRQGRIKKVIVNGCLSQRYPQELLKELPEIDAISGRLSLSSFRQRFAITPGHYAYLKISEGCLHNCSFCVIPRIKGPLRSKPPRDILREVDLLDRQGVRELNIVGQDISAYGREKQKGPRLASLLMSILQRTDNIKWIRLLYLNPAYLTSDLISLIVAHPKICPYIDLPIQHINDRILGLMSRKTNKQQIKRLIKKIRKEIPGAALRTSLIVGFPSETEEEFEELLCFVREARFERLGAFIFSPEEGTAAYNFSGRIPQQVKARRLDKLMRCQQDIAREINRGLLGREIDVIIDGKNKEGGYSGRTRFDAPEVDGGITVNSSEALRPGDIVRVLIEGSYEYDLVGKKVSS